MGGVCKKVEMGVLYVKKCKWGCFLLKKVENGVFFVKKWTFPQRRVDYVGYGISIFTARCYASAVLAMGLCLSESVCVCLSQVGVLLKRLNR